MTRPEMEDFLSMVMSREKRGVAIFPSAKYEDGRILLMDGKDSTSVRRIWASIVQDPNKYALLSSAQLDRGLQQEYLRKLGMGFDRELALEAADMNLDAEEAIFYCTGTDEFKRDKRKAHHEWLELNRKAQLSSRKRTR